MSKKEIKIHCKYDELVPVNKLKPHPKNPNKHPQEQIERLAKILAYQGFRYPIKISKQTGFITSGHGRILAAKLNNWKEVPVNYQDYESDEQEYADIVADNSVASWAELSLSDINLELPELGPDFDIEMLGLKNFMLEPADKQDYREEWKGMPEFNQEDKEGYHTIKVHFQDAISLGKFKELVRQPITNKTKSIWYPAIEKESFKDIGYETDEP